MKCEDVSALLHEHAEGRLAALRSASIDAHAARCEDCAGALEALSTLRSTRERPIPEPRAGFFDQALETAARQPRVQQVSLFSRGFWSGAGVGGALAAGIVMAVMSSRAVDHLPPSRSATDIAIAVHDTKDVMVAIDSRREIASAEIRVVLSGGIRLTGYEGRNEVSWSAPLSRGVNMLTLPVMMLGRTGGHLLVEIAYGEQRQTYAVQLIAIS